MDIFILTATVCITLFIVMTLYLFFTKKGNRISNKFLSFFFFLWALNFLEALLLLEGYFFTHPYLALWVEPMVFLYGPLVFFYSRSVFGNAKLAQKDLIHFGPFIFLLILMIFSYHIKDQDTKIEILRSLLNEGQPPAVFVSTLLVYSHFFGYILYSKKIIGKSTQNLSHLYSSYNVKWLKDILNSITVILVVSFSVGLFHYFEPNIYFKFGPPIVAICIGIILFRLVVKAMDEPLLATDKNWVNKRQKSRVEKVEAEAISRKILNSLDNDQAYLQPDLTLEQLSNLIEEEPLKVSKVINDIFKKSFFDFINGYRIEAAKKLLEKNEDKKITILEIMYDVGFNSKSSFNTQFKNRTGLTPSEYRRLKS